jgi:DNA (cytosine-5)-methyltransferase 1
MAPRPQLAGLSLFAGTGMLDEGVRAGFDYLGLDYRCVGYVERDAYAASALVARMEGQAVDQAPVWDDITTFDGRAWRGVVDCLVAGFPCQDISVAGRRAGLDGKRSGLFFRILDVADDCGAWCLVLENVAGIASATATVVDETEGELFERAAARVVGELADRGWDAEWLHLRASDVGAAHQRERWFCFAWRREVADTESGRGGFRQQPELARRGEAEGADAAMEHAECPRWEAPAGRHEHARSEPVTASESVADTASNRYERRRNARGRRDGFADIDKPLADPARLPSWQRPGRKRIFHGDPQLEHAEIDRRSQGRAEHDRLEGRHAAAKHGRKLGLADGPHREGGGEPSDEEGRTEPDGHAGLAGRELFAPGPTDPRWAGIIAAAPWLAPAVEPGVCRLVDGLAYRVDEHRADRLRCAGNGVVALQAAAALVELVRRSLK